MQTDSLIIISGVSGSGKTTALNALEDLGFFCVDNLPTPLITPFVDFLLNLPEEWSVQITPFLESKPKLQASQKRFALLVDCRDDHSVPLVLQAAERLRSAGTKVELLYFDCQDEVLLRRYQETRRPHPLLMQPGEHNTIADALRRERELLSDFRATSNFVFDTTSYTPHELRHAMSRFTGQKVGLEVIFLSFGFKYGVPTDVDLIVDVRFLPNPHFVAELRDCTGLDKRVRDYALENDDAGEFLRHYENLLRFLIPRYEREGKRYLTIGVGCTGGRHRSVAVASELVQKLADIGTKMILRHRDKDRIV